MKKLIFLTVIFSLVVFSCNHAPKTGSTGEMASKDSLGNGPVIYFPQDTLDFGTLKEGEKYEFKFALINKGNEDLTIFSVPPSCGCTVTQYDPKPIKPGETSEIQGVFNSSGKIGIQHKTLTVNSNAVNGTLRLYIKGEVVPNK